MELDIFSTSVVVSMAGLVVAGLSAMLGIWIDRDRSRSVMLATFLSILVLLATVVSLADSYLNGLRSAKLEEDLARILERIEEMSLAKNDADLKKFINREVNAQRRAHPKVLRRLVRRLKARGSDPKKVLERYLPPGDLEGIKGIKKTGEKTPEKGKEKEKERKEQEKRRKTKNKKTRGGDR